MIWIIAEYERRYGKKLNFDGKFSKYVKSVVPEVEVGDAHATWRRSVSFKEYRKVVKTMQKSDVNAMVQADKIRKIFRESWKDRILMSWLPLEYERRHGKELDYSGKFNTYLKSAVPEVDIQDKMFVTWKGSHVREHHSEAVESQEKDNAKIAVHDSSADIITFKESVNAKAAQKNVDSDTFNFSAGFESMSLEERAVTLNEAAASFFRPTSATVDGIGKNRGLALLSSSGMENHPEGALFGHLLPSASSSNEVGDAVYLGTHEPFCFITVGVQGAGKSHTSSCVLESCSVPFSPGGDVVKLKSPMTSLVLHYDQNTSSICEAAGLLSPNPAVAARLSPFGHEARAVPKDKAVILVSPAFYVQRRKFYGEYCTVRPLLFRWRSLTADHIKRLMRIESGDNQLYVASFLDLLRSYQRQAQVPDFSYFLEQVRKVCNVNGQKGPLDQRIALLESVVAESEKNTALVKEGLDLISSSKNGYHFIIADLTDPLLSKEEANSLFQVLAEQFRTLPTKGGKVLCLDEAHKYMRGDKADGLSEAIVNVARLMRHDGVRLVVSTQSPKALAPELLELVTVAALHHFHSPDWWNYLESKLPLHQGAFERILSLNSGEAVVFATSHDLSADSVEGSHCLPLLVRPRITEDLGSSRRNL